MRLFYSAVIFLLCVLVSPLYAVELPDNFSELPEDVQAVILEYTFFSEQADKVWGNEFEESSIHSMVKYLDDFHTRVRIDFSRGNIRVESQGSKTPIQSLQKAISATLLTPANPNAIDLYTAADFGLTGKPFLAGQVVDQNGKHILYPWRAERFARYLTSVKLKKHGARYWVDIPMVGNYKKISAGRYHYPVAQAAKKYRLSEALILAVIETESSFNPMAVSHANAYGLMQVMRNTAGKDVFQRIYKRRDKPTRQYLLNPEKNIDAGSAYLSILRDVYLKDIRGWLKKEYCMIAAYNGGAGNLFKAFHPNRKKAIAKINAMSTEQVYRHIVSRHPKAESRNYLKKVTRFKKKYVNW
ncbi:murein transglycosylase domain-containing protein [Bacterioplanoides sp.]|uniref:murein transglycosylase domain-containing protein n=1 Tax=Bacterioplanoides sp. TaxID=2066072 RepID=UPI003AFFA893